MKSKKWTMFGSAFVLIILVVAGYIAVAAEAGTAEDPLVTVGYINDVLMPNAMEKIDKLVKDKVKEAFSDIDAKISGLNKSVESTASDVENSYVDAATNKDFVNQVKAEVLQELTKGSGNFASYKVVDVAQGKTLKATVGTELLLRTGSASCYAASATGLINISKSTVIENGAKLEANNLYLVTIDQRGLKATTACKVLVRGNYEVE